MTDQNASSKLRNKAKEILQKRVPQSEEKLKALSTEEMQQTLHELQVHQIELEIQNEELRRANGDLDALRARYFDLYNLASVCHFTVSKQGLIVEANLTAAILLGVDRRMLIHLPFTQFIREEDQDAYYLYRRQLLESSEPLELELRMVKYDGTFFWSHLTACIADGDGDAPVCHITLFDITERKQVEEKFRSSDEKYRSLVETTSDCIWEVDSLGRFTYLSPNFQDMMGYTLDEYIGKYPHDLLLEDDSQQFREQMLALLAAQKPFSSLEVHAKHRDGRLVIAEVSGVPVFSLEGEFLGMRGVTRDSTERKLAEKILWDEQEQLAFVIEAARLGTWEWNVQNNESLINKNWAAMLGYTVNELMPCSYHTWAQLVHPEDLAKAEKSVMQCIEGETLFYESEFRMRHKDGHWVWILDRGRLMTRNADGKPLKMYGMHVDITKRKRVEQEREQYFRLFNNSSDLMCIVDSSDCFIRVNPAFTKVLDCSEQEIIGHPFTEFIHPDDLQKTQDQVAQQYQGRVIINFENRYLRQDGSVCWLSWRGFYNKEDDLIYATARDVTELKMAEEELRRAEAYARSLIEVSLDPLMTIALDGRISDVNEASVQTTGYSREEMIGTDFSFYFTSPVRAEAGYLQVFKNGSVRDYPLEIRHRDGRITPVLYNAAVFLDQAKQVAGVFAAARDVSKLKQAEEQLKAINNQLERKVEQRTLELQKTQKQYLHAEKLSAIGKLSASIAHEFNNPLQGIQSILKGLRKRAILEEEDSKLLDAAIGESERVKDLIRSLQDFNRPSSGRKVLVNLHNSLDSLLLLHKSEFKNKRISVTLDYAKNLPQILAVLDQIKQVFLNLLTNAADACLQPGGVIKVSTWQEDNKVAVVIKDTGIGIKPENMGLIFQPFYTTKPAVKGTGLGLSVSHGIVKNHGGEILVTSRPGEGAKFTVLLPINSGFELVDANPGSTPGS